MGAFKLLAGVELAFFLRSLLEPVLGNFKPEVSLLNYFFSIGFIYARPGLLWFTLSDPLTLRAAGLILGYTLNLLSYVTIASSMWIPMA